MATNSSILAWPIPWTEEPDRLQSWGHKESDMTKRLSLFFTAAKNSCSECIHGSLLHCQPIWFFPKTSITIFLT